MGLTCVGFAISIRLIVALGLTRNKPGICSVLPAHLAYREAMNFNSARSCRKLSQMSKGRVTDMRDWLCSGGEVKGLQLDRLLSLWLIQRFQIPERAPGERRLPAVEHSRLSCDCRK